MKTVEELLKCLKSDCRGCERENYASCEVNGYAVEVIEALQAENTALKAKLDKAVEDLSRMANGYKDCGNCANIGDTIGKCEYQHTGDCYKWRGEETK